MQQQHIPPEHCQRQAPPCSMMPIGGGGQHGGGMIPMCGGHQASGATYAMMPPGDAPGGCTASGAPCIHACMVVAADGTQQLVMPYPSSQPCRFQTVQCAVPSQSCQLPPAMFSTMPSFQGTQVAQPRHGLYGECAGPVGVSPVGMLLAGGMSMGGGVPRSDGCFPMGMPSNDAGAVTSSNPKIGEVAPASMSARTPHSRRGSDNAPMAGGMQPHALPCLGSVECPNQGSVGHSKGSCRPCAFFHSPGCTNGAACPFCHLCDAGERKRRKKQQQQSKKSATKFRTAPRTRQ